MHLTGMPMGAWMLQNQAAGVAQSATPQPRLVTAAHQFEASMMQELLKPLTPKNSMLLEDDGSEDADDEGSANALGEYASEALGQALSEHGGFGIADKIIHQLSQKPGSKQNTSETGKLHEISTVQAIK